MRLLHIMAEMDPKKGGVGQAVRLLMKGIGDAGTQNEAVCLDLQDAAFLSNNSLKVHALGKGNGPWCFNAQLLPWLIENLASYDVVIVHGLWLYPGFAARKALQILKRKNSKSIKTTVVPKLFVMPHGMLDPYFQKASGRKMKAVRNWMYWKLIEGKLVNDAEGLFFTSEEEKILAREPFFPYKPKSEVMIGLGIEAPPPYDLAMKRAFDEKCPGLNGAPYLLFIGRIDEKKGIDLLIMAYTKLLDKYYDEGNQFRNYYFPKIVIAGPGIETSYGQKIKQLASRHQSHIFFPGMLLSNAKWGAFYGCDASVLPSHQENFGIAVVEALACGKPVLISNQINIWRDIEASAAGMVESDTEKGFQNLLEDWFVMESGKKFTMGENAKRCFLEKFALSATSKRLLDCL